MTHLIIKACKALQAHAVLDLVWQLQVHRAQFEIGSFKYTEHNSKHWLLLRIFLGLVQSLMTPLLIHSSISFSSKSNSLSTTSPTFSSKSTFVELDMMKQMLA